VRTLCTNRDLPLLLAHRNAAGDFSTTHTSAAVGKICLVAGPSRPTASLADGDITWRLISHLSLNYLAMWDRSAQEGAAALQELLGLYLALGEHNLGGQISGIQAMELAPITRRLPQHEQLVVYGRGVGVNVTVDESSYGGISPWPLMAVMERFFARHVGVNSFIELALQSTQRGKLANWPLRVGSRPHV
jgi:type VI secretion system protein ImpG